jgi:hypothetical protein
VHNPGLHIEANYAQSFLAIIDIYRRKVSESIDDQALRYVSRKPSNSNFGARPAECAKKAHEVLELAPLAPSATKQLFRASRFDPDFAVHELHAIYSELKKN